MQMGQPRELPARWIVADFPSAHQAQRAMEVLQRHGATAQFVAPSSPEGRAGDEGIAMVRFGTLALAGLLAGCLGGLILGILIWNGQLVLVPFAPTLAAGRTAVPVLLAGILGAIGWLIGALLPLALAHPVTIAVRAPMISEEVDRLARQLASLGALGLRVTSAPSITSG